MPLMVYTHGESRRSEHAQKARSERSRSSWKANQKRAKSGNKWWERPRAEWRPVEAASSGSAAVAAEPGPAEGPQADAYGSHNAHEFQPDDTYMHDEFKFGDFWREGDFSAPRGIWANEGEPWKVPTDGLNLPE